MFNDEDNDPQVHQQFMNFIVSPETIEFLHWSTIITVSIQDLI